MRLPGGAHPLIYRHPTTNRPTLCFHCGEAFVHGIENRRTGNVHARGSARGNPRPARNVAVCRRTDCCPSQLGCRRVLILGPCTHYARQGGGTRERKSICSCWNFQNSWSHRRGCWTCLGRLAILPSSTTSRWGTTRAKVCHNTLAAPALHCPALHACPWLDRAGGRVGLLCPSPAWPRACSSAC